MNYEVVLPQTIQERIAEWGLSQELEEVLFRFLVVELAVDPFSRWPLAIAPTPTVSVAFRLQDPDILGITHMFSFQFTLGPKDFHLYAYDCHHDTEELWQTSDDPPQSEFDSSTDPDYGIYPDEE